MAGKAGRRDQGAIRKLASGRWQASYVHDGRRWFAPKTFVKKGDATKFLAEADRAVSEGTWTRPDAPEPVAPAELPTLGAYVESWIEKRTVKGRPLKPRTKDHYQSLVANHFKTLVGLRLDQLTKAEVDDWFIELPADKGTTRAHCYQLLRSVMTSAVDEDLVDRNPCRIRGAGASPERTKEPEPLSPAEFKALMAALPEKYRAVLAVGAGASMRFGEVASLRVRDVNLETGMVTVDGGMVRIKDGDGWAWVESTTKTGKENVVNMPAELLNIVAKHIANHADGQPDAWLFPAARNPKNPISHSTIQKAFDAAAKKPGVRRVTSHVALRHTGQQFAAESGATLGDLMARAGQSSVGAAQRYLHTTPARQKKLALEMNKLFVEDEKAS